MILAIDPGNDQSAYLFYEELTRKPILWDIVENEAIRTMLDNAEHCNTLAIEMVQSFGMPVGKSVFETCVWTGRFIERYLVPRRISVPVERKVITVTRKDVVLYLCGTHRAKDKNVRQAIMDRYGSTRRAAIGIKAAKGPLYGISTHCWSALGVAITAAETSQPTHN
jgi:hypothetical protein